MSSKVGYQTLSICLLNWHPLRKGGKRDKKLIKIKMCRLFDFRQTGSFVRCKINNFIKAKYLRRGVQQKTAGSEWNVKLATMRCEIAVRERATLKI